MTEQIEQHPDDQYQPPGQPDLQLGRMYINACILARKGRYGQATQMLEDAMACEDCSPAKALDLQAKIYAQQGLNLEAQACWLQAKQYDVDNPAYDRALGRLHRISPWAGHPLFILAALTLIMSTTLLIWQLQSSWMHSVEPLPTVQSNDRLHQSQPSISESQAIGDLNQKVTQLQEQVANLLVLVNQINEQTQIRTLRVEGQLSVAPSTDQTGMAGDQPSQQPQ